MPPIACILVSDFPLAALIRANPELRDRPVASLTELNEAVQVSGRAAAARVAAAIL